MPRLLSANFILVILLVFACRANAQDGWFDAQFGSGGARLVTIQGYYDDLASVRVQADGKFVLAGTCSRLRSTGTYEPFFCLARVNRDGSFDPGFGPSGAGYLLFDQLVLPPMVAPTLTCLGLLPDGRIVVAGTANDQPVVILVRANGTVADAYAYPVFDSDDLSGSVQGLEVQPDGKIVLIGSANEDFAARRLRPDLTPDTTFGNQGMALAGFGSGARATAIALQHDGKIVLAGAVAASSGRDFAVARLLSNGSPDPAFNGSGRATFNVADDDAAAALALDRQGRIVVAGYASPFASGGWGIDFIVNRLLPTGAQDPSFAGASPVDVFVDFGGDRDDVLRGLSLQGDGKIVVSGRSTYSDTQKVFSVARLDADGNTDPDFGISGRSFGTFEPGNANAIWAEAVSTVVSGGLYVFGNGRDLAGTIQLQTFGMARLQLDAIFADGFER